MKIMGSQLGGNWYLGDEENSVNNGQKTIAVATKPVPKTKRPSKYKVLLLNDDYTPMDFVIAVLMQIFGKSAREATKIMMDVHEKGSGVAGVYIRDIAETKCELSNKIAFEKGFPLKTKVQQE